MDPVGELPVAKVGIDAGDHLDPDLIFVADQL